MKNRPIRRHGERAPMLAALVLTTAFAACGTDDKAGFSTDAPQQPSFTVVDEGGAPPVTPVAETPRPTPVDVVVTADNAYSFGWGDENAVRTFYRNPPAHTAAEIFFCPIGLGPEAYTVPANEALPGAWLYVVAWADYTTTQGVIGQFKHRGGDAIYTGAGEWQGCATGISYPDNAGSPDEQIVNEQIAICNAGTGDPATTSAGWVGVSGAITPNAVGTVVFGQDNASDVDRRGEVGFDFPPVCKHDVTHEGQGIEANARWMWYAPPAFSTNPFRATKGNDTRMFLVFRFPTKAIPQPVPPK